MPKEAEIDGLELFAGDVYFTSRWPHESVDFTGKRVAVIGTGSSGVQSIPVIAQEARQLVVFQRTPNFSIPAHNGPLSRKKLAQLDGDEAGYRNAARTSPGGIPMQRSQTPTFSVSATERQQRYERAWAIGELFEMVGVYADVLSNRAANDSLAEFFRTKIRSIVNDPQTASMLCPTDHPIGTKRPCLDTNYYATFNLPHVRLVDIRTHPIRHITNRGIDTVDESFEFDAIVFATGFDALTGAITAVDIVGRDGLALKDKWSTGPSTYLGTVHGRFSPISSCSPVPEAPPSCRTWSSLSSSTWTGWPSASRSFACVGSTSSNPPNWRKPVGCGTSRTALPSPSFPLRTRGTWAPTCRASPGSSCPTPQASTSTGPPATKWSHRDYLGFRLSGPGGQHCHDGIVRRLQPDVEMVLNELAALNLPAIESMTVDDARAFVVQSAANRPPGPDVREVIDGTLPGAAGDLAYRLYRPPTTGPHPIVVYFHGGGWVLGDATSDDPLCRDLCVRSDAVIVSANYRHAPEHPFPAAVNDGLAAVRWIADHAAALGGIPGQLAVCGWSAGANIATVVCRLARDLGGPLMVGQALLAPATDCDLTRLSYVSTERDTT